MEVEAMKRANYEEKTKRENALIFFSERKRTKFSLCENLNGKFFENLLNLQEFTGRIQRFGLDDP